MMEVFCKTSNCIENRPLDLDYLMTPYELKKPTENNNEQKRPAENNANTTGFVNHAAIAWEESRKTWIGDLSQRPKRMPKDPIISWSTTYEDLLSTNHPFPEQIALYEMVDFLVDIWHDEGLFD